MRLTESIRKSLNEEYEIYDDIVDKVLAGEEVYVRLEEETEGTNIYQISIEQYPISPEKYDEGYILGWDRGADPEYDKEQDRKYERAKEAYENGDVFVFDAVKVEDGKINKTGFTYLTCYGVDELLEDLRYLNAKPLKVKTVKSLEESAVNSVVEYTILFEPGEYYDTYGGEFITENDWEAEDLFNEIKEEGKLDQVQEYFSKEWIQREPGADYEEGYVEVFYAGEDLEESEKKELKDLEKDNKRAEEVLNNPKARWEEKVQAEEDIKDNNREISKLNAKGSLTEAEEEYHPNGVIDDIKRRGTGDTDIESPMDLNTGVLPLIDAGIYGREDMIWGYDEETDEETGPSREDLVEAMKKAAQPILEEAIKHVLPSASVNVTGLYSPQYYNYETDQLEFTVSFDTKEFEEVMNRVVKLPEFNEYLKKNYSSRSGFFSYLADNVEEFWEQDGWKKFVQVIMFYFRDDSEQEHRDEEFWDDTLQNTY